MQRKKRQRKGSLPASLGRKIQMVQHLGIQVLNIQMCMDENLNYLCPWERRGGEEQKQTMRKTTKMPQGCISLALCVKHF